MDSITIGWKKQAPGKVEIRPRAKAVEKPRIHKVQPKKPQETIQTANLFQRGNNQPNRPNRPNRPNQFIDHSYILLTKPDAVSKGSNDTISDIEIYNDNRLCSVRSAIATFAIAIILILVSGIAVGIVFATVKPGSSGSGSGNNNNQNSYVTVGSDSVTSSIIIGSQSGSGCSSYTQIDDPTRSINNAATSTSCDNGAIFNATSEGSWIRFVGSGGTYIPLTSPGMNRCGGFLSGYFNDTLPTAGSPTINGTICFDADGGDCIFTFNVTVEYCAPGVYVYLLPPVPVCNARYCTTV